MTRLPRRIGPHPCSGSSQAGIHNGRLCDGSYAQSQLWVPSRLPALRRFYRDNDVRNEFVSRSRCERERDYSDVPTDHVITNLATLWLKQHGREKFFLFLHYWDCHYDYIPPPPYDRQFDPDYKGKENGRNIA